MTELVWNDTHTINSQHKYCYCGRDRNLLEITIQCRLCKNWFHSECTTISNPPDLLFTTNYNFVCQNCNKEGDFDIFERTTAGWKDICSTAIANLILEEILARIGHNETLFDSKNANLMQEWHPEEYYFNKKEIIPFVDKHWQSLCTERARTTTWWATLGSCLYSSKETFMSRDERQRSAASDFRLVDANLWHIRPSFIQYGGKSLPRTQQDLTTPMTTPSPRSSSPTPLFNVLPAVIFPQSSSSSTADHPSNRFGFKYTYCEPSILSLVGYQQVANKDGCTLSITDKSPYVFVAKDGLTVTTEKGFRMCRANVGVKEGAWYWEAMIQNAAGPANDNGPHVRIGWARREACLNAPVGYDAYGYGYRDKTGDKLFCSRPSQYGEPFQTGDVIGLYISLPTRPFKSVTRRRIPIAYKEHLWFEEKDYRPSKEMEALKDPYKEVDYEPKILKGSSITVYKNGINQGVMFTDLFDYEDFGSWPETIMAKRRQRAKKKRKQSSKQQDELNGQQRWTEDPPVEDDGTLGYYPAVSVYKGAVVTCNFGPHFQYPPTDQKEDWKPYCERYDEYMAEECVWDLLDEVSRSFKQQKKVI
ncbi:uncharacterized protein BX663DRAFT_508795 [Cokeromyces recurvatus]|uniref:uncharacterized protein n=1 Tax=Cokeromyces recurvatus TaxID=90255 RepID=UPI0022209F6C|nr:uncharacterized protein BX663DRAFT_508795 [Cokeromyces recurvatus]KAI7902895.1 hypothetical protein BX663DRAFT_508795 [Cokeromyces recurvatus]